MSRHILDTRDLNKRKEELEALRDAVESAQEELDEAREALAQFDADDEADKEELEESVSDAESALESAIADFGDDEKAELEELEELESEISEWRHGETMIPESEWLDYVQQFAEDIGAINDNATWPNNCIDWNRAADELAMDYSQVEYQGVTYYVRSC